MKGGHFLPHRFTFPMWTTVDTYRASSYGKHWVSMKPLSRLSSASARLGQQRLGITGKQGKPNAPVFFFSHFQTKITQQQCKNRYKRINISMLMVISMFMWLLTNPDTTSIAAFMVSRRLYIFTFLCSCLNQCNVYASKGWMSCRTSTQAVVMRQLCIIIAKERDGLFSFSDTYHSGALERLFNIMAALFEIRDILIRAPCRNCFSQRFLQTDMYVFVFTYPRIYC